MKYNVIERYCDLKSGDVLYGYIPSVTLVLGTRIKDEIMEIGWWNESMGEIWNKVNDTTRLPWGVVVVRKDEILYSGDRNR